MVTSAPEAAEVTQRRASGPCSRLGRNFARARANNAVPQSSRSSPSLSKGIWRGHLRDESPSSTHRSWIIPSSGRARSRYSGAPNASFAFISSFRRALRRRSLAAQRATRLAPSSACLSSASLLRGSPAADPLPCTNTPSRPRAPYRPDRRLAIGPEKWSLEGPCRRQGYAPRRPR